MRTLPGRGLLVDGKVRDNYFILLPLETVLSSHWDISLNQRLVTYSLIIRSGCSIKSNPLVATVAPTASMA